MLLPGRASQSLAVALADATESRLGAVQTRRFPDGELLVEIPPDPGERAVIVASITSEERFLELLLLQDAAREAGVSELTTIVPYLGYARQDQAFEPGQPVSARAVCQAIGATTDRLVTIDPHEESVLDHAPTPTAAFSAADQLATPLPADLTDPLFLAPDAGAAEVATRVRDAYGTGQVDYFRKERQSDREVDIVPGEASPTDRDVVIVDDIIATGGTMTKAVEIIADRSADRIYAACVHPMLADRARTRLASAGVTNVYGTDTIERPESRVSAAPAVIPAITGNVD